MSTDSNTKSPPTSPSNEPDAAVSGPSKQKTPSAFTSSASHKLSWDDYLESLNDSDEIQDQAEKSESESSYDSHPSWTDDGGDSDSDYDFD